jgi:hypothetical protein
MTISSWILVGVIVVAIIGFIINGHKKTWFKIYLANNDVLLVYRKMSDWWSKDGSGIMGFSLPDGRSIKVSKHWIIKIEAENDELPK